jgi:DNA-binding Lrp family transcriptional regulator
MDLKNRRILHELDKNARLSYSEIAKRIKLSKNAVINRIKELEAQQIILGYNTIININSLGYTTYDIYLKLKSVSIEKENEIIGDLIKSKEVWLLAKVEGNVNLSLLISTKTPEEFNQIWESIYQKIKPNVELVRTSILLEYHHFPRKYLSDTVEKETVIIGKRNNVMIDKVDYTLLNELASNARISLLYLSQKLKLNPKTISLRIKKLEKEKVILGYRVNLNFRKMGYTYYKMLVNLNNLSIRTKMYNYVKHHRNVVYYDKFIGGTDFEFDLEVESFEVFVKFLEEFKNNFGAEISDYSYLNPTIIYKSEYFSGG